MERKRLKSEFYYNQSDINKVMFQLNTLEVISDLNPLRKSGKGYVGKCRICRTRTNNINHFRVEFKKEVWFYKTKNTYLYKCFECGAGGTNGISFVMRYFNIPFHIALEYCNNRYVNADITLMRKENARRNRVIIDDSLPF